jgi:hypothetical protein
MKAQIWKYQVPQNRLFEIEMPAAAHILSVQMQQDKTCIWALVNPLLTKEMRKFQMVGTGHEFDLFPTHRFIGTFQDGPFVFHLFEIL